MEDLRSPPASSSNYPNNNNEEQHLPDELAQTVESLGLGEIEIELEEFSNPKAIDLEKNTTSTSKDLKTTTIVGPNGWERQVQSGLISERVKLTKYCPKCCPSLETFQPYFNITTAQLKKRLLLSLNPFSPKFFDDYKDKPDLYGPFWIQTSLIASLFISANISRYIDWPEDSEEKFKYTFQVIPVAATIIYGLGFFLPLGVKFLVNTMGKQDKKQPEEAGVNSYLMAIGIYGYSFSSFLAMSILCGLVPVEALHWLFILAGGLWSTGFLWVTYWNDFQEKLEGNVRWIAVGTICAVQIVLILMFKFYFFQHLK